MGTSEKWVQQMGEATVAPNAALSGKDVESEYIVCILQKFFNFCFYGGGSHSYKI